MAIALGLGYLLGSIPFGLLFTRAAGLGDVRQIGSGNIGATNVLQNRPQRNRGGDASVRCRKRRSRGAGRRPLFRTGTRNLAGLGAFLGHVFPVWLKFKGGKGVATYLGVLLAIVWQAAAVFAVVWLAVAAATRISSLAAMVATIAAPIAVYALGLEENLPSSQR